MFEPGSAIAYLARWQHAALEDCDHGLPHRGGAVPDRHDSIVGSTFTGTVLDTVDAGGHPAVIPQVTGTAYRTGEHLFSIDPHDPLVPGFVLR